VRGADDDRAVVAQQEQATVGSGAERRDEAPAVADALYDDAGRAPARTLTAPLVGAVGGVEQDKKLAVADVVREVRVLFTDDRGHDVELGRTGVCEQVRLEDLVSRPVDDQRRVAEVQLRRVVHLLVGGAQHDEVDRRRERVPQHREQKVRPHRHHRRALSPMIRTVVPGRRIPSVRRGQGETMRECVDHWRSRR